MIERYYNLFDPADHYSQLLFRAGDGLQSRELNEIQSTLMHRLQGVADASLQGATLRADFDWPRADKRQEFLRVRRNAQGGLDLFANQSSGVLTSAVWGDGLVDNPAGKTIQKGDSVRFVSFAELLA